MSPEQEKQLAELEALKAASAPTQEGSEGKIAALAGRVAETAAGGVAAVGTVALLKAGFNLARGARNGTEETARAIAGSGRKRWL